MVADIIKYDITTDLVGPLLFPKLRRWCIFIFSMGESPRIQIWHEDDEYIYLTLKVKKTLSGWVNST